MFTQKLHEIERDFVKLLAEYSKVLIEAIDNHAPSKIARYAYELAHIFNLFYSKVSVLKAETPELIESRLRLVTATSQVLSNALGILGVKVPEAM